MAFGSGRPIRTALCDTRHEAMEPLRQGVNARFGAIGEEMAAGLSLLDDRGSQYMSHDFQTEIRWLVVTSSPLFVPPSEGNVCANRFILTLKENLFWVQTFATVEELRLALMEFQQSQNENWLIERHDHCWPARFRREQLAPAPLHHDQPIFSN